MEAQDDVFDSKQYFVWFLLFVFFVFHRVHSPLDRDIYSLEIVLPCVAVKCLLVGRGVWRHVFTPLGRKDCYERCFEWHP